LYFADHKEELRESIRNGRQEFLSQFPSLRDPQILRRLPSPVERAPFERSKLKPAERERNTEAWHLHRDLIALRRSDPVVGTPDRIDGAVLGSGAFVLRYFGGERGDRLLVVNLGSDIDLRPCPEPLLAPPGSTDWQLAWTTDDPKYGGRGTPPLNTDEVWRLPGECAVLLAAPRDADDDC
jgi:maltooligosyltrehalose trehalohydrolase